MSIVSLVPVSKGVSPRFWFTTATSSVGILLIYLFIWVHITPGQIRQTDFSVFYTAALLIHGGHGSQLYNQAMEAAQHAALLLPGTTGKFYLLPFDTPPTSALLALPLVGLGIGVSYWVYATLQLLLLTIAAVIAGRAAPWPSDHAGRCAAALMALAGCGSFLLVFFGQSDGICVLGLAIAYLAWRHDRSFIAGLTIALGFGLVKPHLAIGLALFMIGRRDGKALLGAGTGAIVVALLCLATGGATGTLAFFGDLASVVNVAPVNVGIFGSAEHLLGRTTAADLFALAITLPVAMMAWVFGAWCRSGTHVLEVTLAGATALSLILAPHLLPYDLTILCPPLIWMTGRALMESTYCWNLSVRQLLVGWLALSLLMMLGSFTPIADGPVPIGAAIPILLLVGCGVPLWRWRKTSAKQGYTRSQTLGFQGREPL